MLILAYAGMYIVIILRTQQDALLDLGFDSVLYPIGFSCAATLYGTSRIYIDHLTRVGPLTTTVKAEGTLKQRGFSGLDF